jgi:uncharacterized OsmC-like protein
MKEAFERTKHALELRPNTGQKTTTCSASITDGYTCLIEEGRWRLVSDLHENVGGSGLGPDPSLLGRAAFASCAAISYVQWAAVLGIKLSEVKVVVETDYDYGGYFGTNDSPAGPIEVRTLVSIESDAPESEIMSLVDKADHHSPLHSLWARPLKLNRKVEITRTED